jgi:hypothetical protein
MHTYLLYLRYVVVHKWWVMLECFKFGLYWRGLVHDLSKLRPSEFFPYAHFFYRKRARDDVGYYNRIPTGDHEFDEAWLLHQKCNDHHWQWWVLSKDDGGVKVLPMSEPARTEMLCDWRGAGRAQGFLDTVAWYRKHSHKMQLHPDTRAWLEEQLGLATHSETQG